MSKSKASCQSSTDVEFHAAADIFPMDDENMDALVADIKKNGLQCPIEFYHNQIIDGRRRYMACRMAGVEPASVDVSEIADPIAYVLSLNLHRRHLTPSQKSMVAARAREMYDSAAKERQREHSNTAPGKKKTLPVNLPEVNNGDARDAAGKALGVSGKSVDYATKVLATGTPELVKAVDEGRIAVSTAATLATAPPAAQLQELQSGRHNRKYGPGPGGVRRKVSKRPSRNGKQSRGAGWKTRSVSRDDAEALSALVDQLVQRLDRPAMTISMSTVRTHVKEIHAAISKMFPLS